MPPAYAKGLNVVGQQSSWKSFLSVRVVLWRSVKVEKLQVQLFLEDVIPTDV